MLQRIYYSQKSNKAVQVISQCKILPEGTEAICYQEMTGAFPVYVMEKGQFYETYCERQPRMTGEETAEKAQKAAVRADDKIHGEIKDSRESDHSEVSNLIRFLDADTYWEKSKILEGMKDELDEHILNNMAVSLDLSIEDGVDGYSFLMSELKIRSRFEGKRGERL